jgi:hypothetical protein
VTSYKMAKMNGVARTIRAAELDRRLVCRRCGHIMSDYEPDAGYGEFGHDRRVCSNSGKLFSLAPEHSKEVMPFESKRVRRAAKRAGTGV